MIVRVNVVLNRTVVVDSDWRFDNQCSSHFLSESAEDDYCTGCCRNVSYCQHQFYSGLRSPGRSCSTYLLGSNLSQYDEFR